MLRVNDIRDHFIRELKEERFTIDRGGNKTIEYLGASFIANENAIFGKPNFEYIQKEIDWYTSESTNIHDIEGDPPSAWVYTANSHGEINSNYGHLIYSTKYHNQYRKVLIELLRLPESRRATMVYTRPSIWIEYNENGKNDFICTNAVSYFIRDNKVHCVVQMRSNDIIYGYRNDFAWQNYVLRKLTYDVNSILEKNINYEVGDIFWQVSNLHVYERHFYLVDAYDKGIDFISRKRYTEMFPDSQW